MEPIRNITGGVYLVIDPARKAQGLFRAVEQALRGGVDILQVWNHWLPGQDKRAFVAQVCAMAHARQVPVLINEEQELLQGTGLDGIHFDEPPAGLQALRRSAGRPLIMGLTCGNDLERVRLAIREGFDYLSFCAMFPSRSAGSCELVRPETVRAARELGRLPIFVSGGITPGNLVSLAATGLDGVAVISGILDAPDPEAMVRQYKQSIYNTTIKQE